MTTAPSPPRFRKLVLPATLKLALWRGIEKRLRRGDVLITNEQFVRAMVREFRRQVGVEPDMPAKRELLRMVVSVNETRPETYLTLGIRNAISHYVRQAQEHAQGDEGGAITEMISGMIKEGRTAFFLESIGVEVDERTLTHKLEQAILRIVEGKRLRAAPRRRAQPRRRRRAASMVAVHTTAAEQSPEESKPAIEGPPSEEEQQERLAEEETRAEELAQEEMGKAPRNLQAYLEQKLLTEEEADNVRTLHGIEQRLADGEIDEAEADRLRGGIEESVRAKLEERLRAAADHTVHYLSAFEALRRLPAERDGALKMLVRHKNQVSADPEADIDLSVVTSALRQDDELLDQLATLLERKDHEMRMLAAGMPPYRHIYTHGSKIGSWTVREDYVDELRSLTREEVSERLNSEDAQVRLKTAADIKCMVALLAMLMYPSAFHNEVVRLRVVLRMRHLFDGAASEREGRGRVQQFLRRRLPSLYPDLPADIRNSVEQEAQEITGGKEGAGEEEEEDNTRRVYRA